MQHYYKYIINGVKSRMTKSNFSLLLNSSKILLITSSILCSNALAGQATTTLPVTATVVASCSVSVGSGNALNFGNYTLAAINQTATITVTCTNGTAYTIGLDAGANAGGATNYTSRNMKIANGTNLLAYQVYIDSARSTVWNNTNGGNYTGTGSGAAQLIIVYGTVFMNQTSPLGSYSDVMNVYVNY